MANGQAARARTLVGNLAVTMAIVIAAVIAAVIATVTIAPPVHAVSVFDVPFVDRAPAWNARRDAVRTTAVGVPDARIASLSAGRLSGRRRARARALTALHAWADEALAAVRARPDVASRIHGVIDARAEVVATRPLVEGGAVVIVELTGAHLRDAAALSEVPWAL